ncbi:AbrB/MazE/SpoVT family DNA-binding domain-containing protein [Gracilimonas sediminicola]|uniref:Type II toxin-antitoxin system PrlF family antitoxin n=1 Tax=Gracilimonas sediminicola TaxID=2952158 RepID=A0A9X2L2J9_9BACT|nr:type II toxin-antitoxin system PrlF family antitoxin [Gracilimonas sediminicola]MCP9291064.1 type II toxin-antitoxin system PrlF family antitoxin [Gracilimonas sediminicola]
MPTATITSKGQVTIPKKIRDELGLKPGDKVNFEVDKQGNLNVSKKKYSIDDTYGMLHRENQKSYTVEEMDEKLTEYFKKKYKAR